MFIPSTGISDLRKMSFMVTSEQVAQLAGVSRATVSRVLNRSANVSEETRKRIYTAIATLGYGTNAFSRDILQQRSHLIALALFGSEDGLNLSHLTKTQFYFYLQLLRFIEREAAQENFDLFLPSRPYDPVDSADDPETMYALALRERGVEGALTLALRTSDPRIQSLCRSPIPTIFIDDIFQGPHATYVKSDYTEGAHQATNHLLQLGHKRIAYFTGDRLSLTGTERLLGYQQALAHAGVIIDPHLVRTCGWEADEAYQEALTILKERRDFTAIFAASDMMALGVLRALHACGLRVPDDVSVIGFDGINLSEHSDPPLTTIQQNMQAISAGAITKLSQLIKGEEMPEPLIVPTQLIVRASTGPVRRNGSG